MTAEEEKRRRRHEDIEAGFATGVEFALDLLRQTQLSIEASGVAADSSGKLIQTVLTALAHTLGNSHAHRTGVPELIAKEIDRRRAEVPD